MKIVVNCSGLERGGVIQASLSFLDECRKRNGYRFYIFILESQSEVFKVSSFPDNFTFFFFRKSPNKSLSSILKLTKLEKAIKPDYVFTPYGPILWRPKAPHLCGFALPFLVYPESEFFKIYKPSLKFRFERWLKILLTKKTNDAIYVENEDIMQRLIEKYNFKTNMVHYVPGAYNQIYDKPFIERPPFLPEKTENEFRYVTIAPFFKHKNLVIIKEIVDLIKKNQLTQIRFVLTIDDSIFNDHFKNYEDLVYNVGPINLEDCPILYSECDATFMPTLLESFTAIYPDSMKMKKPIVTTDLGFARSVCGDAALYYNPIDANDAFSKVVALSVSKELEKKLVSNGQRRLFNFIKADERASKYFEIMESM